MYIKNNTIAMIFRILFLIVCGAGLVMQLIGTGFGLNAILGDFALISNVLALLYFIYLIIARPDSERGGLRGAVIIYMMLVFIVYYVTYFGASIPHLVHLSLSGYLLYFAAPLMAFLDYLLFCRKGDFTPYSPVIWVIIPILLNLTIFIINRFQLSVSSIPYFSLLGMSLTVTLLAFLGASYLLFLIDSLLSGRRG